MKPCRKKVV